MMVGRFGGWRVGSTLVGRGLPCWGIGVRCLMEFGCQVGLCG